MALTTSPAAAVDTRARPSRGRRSSDRIGDLVLYGLCTGAALLAAVTLGLIAYQVIHGADLSLSRFGLAFVGHTDWAPNIDHYGAGTFLFGTAVTSFMALSLAAPLGIAIGLYLSMLASGRVRAVIGPLVEMLAAIPSVILGLSVILVLAP